MGKSVKTSAAGSRAKTGDAGELAQLREKVAQLSAASERMREAEVQLRAERDRAQKYLDLAGTLLVAIDRDMAVTLINRKGCEVLGCAEEEIVGKNWFDTFIPESMRPAVKDAFHRLIGGEAGIADRFENPVRTARGEEKTIAWHNTVLRDEAGRIVGTLSSGEDITGRREAEEERKKIQAQLFQSQKMEAIGRLAGGIAHDFNNLLTGIMGYAELALSRVNQPESVRQDIEQIIGASERAETLTRQLLAFSSRQMFQPKAMDLNLLVTDLGKMLQRLIGEDVTLVAIMEPATAFIKAERSLIEQVVTNIVLNARDAMPEGGLVIMKTEEATIGAEDAGRTAGARPGRFVVLSISDTGSGMSAETMRHLFEPFFTTKGTGKGTGLGLSVVYGIVKQHDGWITVESNPGQGSIFRVYLPSEQGQQEGQPEARVSSPPGVPGKERRILLVEDEKRVREVVARGLREAGYAVLEAPDAKTALELFDREKDEIDLVFSDVVLPGMTGLKLIDQLLFRKPDLRVLLSSGYTDEESQWSDIIRKGFRFIRKPYTLSDLQQAIRNIFASR